MEGSASGGGPADTAHLSEVKRIRRCSLLRAGTCSPVRLLHLLYPGFVRTWAMSSLSATKALPPHGLCAADTLSWLGTSLPTEVSTTFTQKSPQLLPPGGWISAQLPADRNLHTVPKTSIHCCMGTWSPNPLLYLVAQFFPSLHKCSSSLPVLPKPLPTLLLVGSSTAASWGSGHHYLQLG
jgi:hypothetical protein